MWSGRPEDAELRSSALRAMRAQSMEFSELNVEYGYTHGSAAVVPDDSPAPEPADDIPSTSRRRVRARSQPDPRPSDRSGGRARRGVDRVNEHAGCRGELLRHASGDP
jgi:hypothetical protein